MSERIRIVSAVVLALAALSSAAPVLSQPLSSTYDEQRTRRSEFAMHLGTRCRNLYEFTNQSYSTRMNEYQAQRLRDAQREYQEFCQDEVREAQEKMYKANRAKTIDRVEKEITEKKQTAKQQQDEARTRQQCLESKRIIAEKRERTNLTPGELQDLARFEENVRQRCVSSSTAKAP